MANKKNKFHIVIAGEIINANYKTHKAPTIKYLKSIQRLGKHKVSINQI